MPLNVVKCYRLLIVINVVKSPLTREAAKFYSHFQLLIRDSAHTQHSTAVDHTPTCDMGGVIDRTHMCKVAATLWHYAEAYTDSDTSQDSA